MCDRNARLPERHLYAPVPAPAGMVIRITDPDDPRLDGYRSIRDRDLSSLRGDAGHGGRFVAEGEVVIRALLGPRSRFSAESILVTPEKQERLAGLLRARIDLPVYVVEGDVMSGIAGFPIHRGLLAMGLRGAMSPTSLPPAPTPSVVLGLVGLANHDNVGAAFRNAAAFGVDAVLLDRTCCDPLYRKAIRVSVGACLTVPHHRGGTVLDMLDRLDESGYEVVALSPSGREALGAARWSPRSAILVGTEGAGLPEELLATRRSVRIGMVPGFDSLNVATAAAIALHDARLRHD